jgi:hypothetical protein
MSLSSKPASLCYETIAHHKSVQGGEAKPEALMSEAKSENDRAVMMLVPDFSSFIRATLA